MLFNALREGLAYMDDSIDSCNATTAWLVKQYSVIAVLTKTRGVDPMP